MSKYPSFILLTAIAALTISCGKETIPEPIEELSEEEILAQVRTDVQNTAFYKDIFLNLLFFLQFFGPILCTYRCIGAPFFQKFFLENAC